MIRLGIEREGLDTPSDDGTEKACLECGWPIPLNSYPICEECAEEVANVGDTAA